MVEVYKAYVEKLRRSRPLAQPCIVQSYADALEQLSQSDLFHLAILDLRLPEQAGDEADEGSARGLDLIQKVADREHSPVPALAIITGDSRRITKLGPLQKLLQERFWFGDIIQKSIDLMEDLARVIDKVLEYVDLGLTV